MISIEPRSDMAAVQFMIMDIIEQTLANAENPVWLAQYLTEQIRSLIGGKIVVLFFFPFQHTKNYRIDSIKKKNHAHHKKKVAKLW